MSGTATARKSAKNAGSTMLWVVLTFPVFMGLASFAVDFGRVQLAKTQLRCAVDAAAGAAVLEAGNAANMEAAAISAASQNVVDGSPLVLVAGTSDIEFGTWDTTTKTFTVLTGSACNTATAVRINGQRSAAKGNAISLIFAQVIGRRTCDVYASVIAVAKPYGYGLIGLNYIKMSGNTTASYRSNNPGLLDDHASVGSNGTITLSGSSYIHGDARPGIGKTVVGSAGRVSGIVTPLTTPLSYPLTDPTPYMTTNDNAQIPTINNNSDLNISGSNSVVAPGGNYYLHNLSLSGNASLTFTGPANLYIYGNLNLSGSTTTYNNLPSNLHIYMVDDPVLKGGPGTATVSGSSALYSSIYGPGSAVKLSGTGDIYGSVVGLSVDMSGTSSVYYDLILDSGGGSMFVK